MGMVSVSATLAKWVAAASCWAAVSTLITPVQALAEEPCPSNYSMEAGPSNFVGETCPTKGVLFGYLHFDGDKVYVASDLFTSMNFDQPAVASGRTFIPVELPRDYSDIWQFRERYTDAWVNVSGAVAPNACEDIWQCPQSKALFRASGIKVVQKADYFRLLDLKKGLWEGTSPIHEVVAQDPDRASLVALGEALAKAIQRRDAGAAKVLFPEVASDALYDKYLKPGARVNWLLFSSERAIDSAGLFKLFRLGSGEADVDRVVAFVCYNHDAQSADVWPDSFFDLDFAHVGDPFVCYPLVYEDGRWSVNFHALL